MTWTSPPVGIAVGVEYGRGLQDCLVDKLMSGEWEVSIWRSRYQASDLMINWTLICVFYFNNSCQDRADCSSAQFISTVIPLRLPLRSCQVQDTSS